jgi:hypothetical protein
METVARRSFITTTRETYAKRGSFAEPFSLLKDLLRGVVRPRN